MEKILLRREKKKTNQQNHQKPDTRDIEGLLRVPFFFFNWSILQLRPVCVLYIGNSVGNVNQLVSLMWFCRVMTWLGELEDISVTPTTGYSIPAAVLCRLFI